MCIREEAVCRRQAQTVVPLFLPLSFCETVPYDPEVSTAGFHRSGVGNLCSRARAAVYDRFSSVDSKRERAQGNAEDWHAVERLSDAEIPIERDLGRLV